MTQAEFEERSYEAPLYNQLERGNSIIYTPGQVLESRLGFDRGLFLAELAVWRILGYNAPLPGAALGYYDWPLGWGPPHPSRQLPRFRLNLFLQAKRPTYYKRKPKTVRKIDSISPPLWSFRVAQHQQQLLEVLASKLQGRAHVAYAAAAFHTNSALFTHTKYRSIVAHSTFPSVGALSGHEAWYYHQPGAKGAANPRPESIEEPELLNRLRNFPPTRSVEEGQQLSWLDDLAVGVEEAAREGVETTDAVNAQFFDDLQLVDRLAEAAELPPSLRAYVAVRIFTIRYGISWLVVTDAE